jgi:glycosyltransferase involved in cell wall biosynthesis
MKNKFLLSIIVPLYNAENFLPEFFNSLSNQEYVDENFELLLIDNGSTDNSKDIVEKYIKINQNLHIEYHYFDDVADSYAARNYGVRQSKGEIIAFTDSDCILEPNWIKNVIKFAKPGTIISGEVEIQVTDKKNIWEVFDSFAHLNNKENASVGKIATANLIVRKEDYLSIGFFEERFSGGDHDWSLRAKRKGFEIIYNEEVKVLHPSRKLYQEIINKSKRMAYGAGVNHKNHNKGLISLVALYTAKFFNLKTNIRYSNILRKNGFGIKSIIFFNLRFFKMRYAQLSSTIRGYYKVSARKLDIK